MTIRSITECSWQMRRAEQAVEFRRITPDAFDANGAMIPGQLYRVLEAYAQANPQKALVL